MTSTRWGKAPDELVDMLARATEDLGVERRIMFGYPCYFVNGNMFLGAFEDGAVVRLSTADRQAALLSSEGFSPFEPVPGRVMKEYVVAPGSVYTEEKRFRELVRQSLTYTRSLPAKQPRRSGTGRRKGGQHVEEANSTWL